MRLIRLKCNEKKNTIIESRFVFALQTNGIDSSLTAVNDDG